MGGREKREDVIAGGHKIRILCVSLQPLLSKSYLLLPAHTTDVRCGFPLLVNYCVIWTTFNLFAFLPSQKKLKKTFILLYILY